MRAAGRPVWPLLLLAAWLVSTAAGATEPRIHVMGVWPDRVRFFDEKTDQFVGELHLRHGAVMWPGSWITGTAHTADYRRLFFITDRLQSVEVVDAVRRVVVDDFKLSTPERRVFILGVSPTPDGRRLYMPVRAVRLQRDRFLPEDVEVVLYDLEAHRVEESLHLPDEVRTSAWYPALQVSPDGQSVFAFSGDIYELDAVTLGVVGKLVLTKPLLAGYGPYQGPISGLSEREPGIYWGIYSTSDPFLQKSVVGLTRLDLNRKRVEDFELGPDLDIEHFALSLDGRRGYAGLQDLIVVDMKARRIVERKEDFEQGRTNTALIVSADGHKLYVGGVGDSFQIYDTSTLELLETVFAGGDFTSAPFPLPRSVLKGESRDR
jgi:hypothetical protein